MQYSKPLVFDPMPLQYQRYEDVVSYLNDKIKLNRSSSFHRASCFGLDNFFKSFHLKPNVSAIIQDLYWIISFVLENCPISKVGQVERDSENLKPSNTLYWGQKVKVITNEVKRHSWHHPTQLDPPFQGHPMSIRLVRTSLTIFSFYPFSIWISPFDMSRASRSIRFLETKLRNHRMIKKSKTVEGQNFINSSKTWKYTAFRRW